MKLSVVVVAYNQSPYIRQCMDSVLAQRLDAPWEIVVADDASTDGTADILRGYAARFPDRVRLIAHPINRGLLSNLGAALAATRGEFIAYIDGDDYWTHPRKLARQIQLLETDPRAALCFHSSRIVLGHRPGGILTPPGRRERYHARDLLWTNFIPAQSIVYRRAALFELPAPPSENQATAWDWYCHILATRTAPALYLDDCLSAYRVHSGGLWTSQSLARRLQTQLTVLTQVQPFLPETLSSRLRMARLRIRFQLLKAHTHQLLFSDPVDTHDECGTQPAAPPPVGEDKISRATRNE